MFLFFVLVALFLTWVSSPLWAKFIVERHDGSFRLIKKHLVERK
jgi:hypothetical protein